MRLHHGWQTPPGRAQDRHSTPINERHNRSDNRLMGALLITGSHSISMLTAASSSGKFKHRRVNVTTFDTMKTLTPARGYCLASQAGDLPIIPCHVVRIPVGQCHLEGELSLPQTALGLVMFVHGSGSDRHSPRNQIVAEALRQAGFATLLLDLLTPSEAQEDAITTAFRSNINLLSSRVVAATEWLWRNADTATLTIGLFGSGTGAGVALLAAAQLGSRIGAVVSRGGRPDLAGNAVLLVTAPTLLIAGEYDDAVLRATEKTFAKLKCFKQLRIVRQATHLFAEPGKLSEVAALSVQWFVELLASPKQERLRDDRLGPQEWAPGRPLAFHHIP